MWGITASDSIKGYVAWGGPPRDPAIDGTVVPSAAGGSLMFTPDISLETMHAMRERFGQKIYGKYGFVDAFNPNNGWVDTDVIGISAGIILLSAENLRTGWSWQWFMQNNEIRRAMRLVGLNVYRSFGQPKVRSRAHHPLRRLCAFAPLRESISAHKNRFRKGAKPAKV